jgi:hypothetical protein
MTVSYEGGLKGQFELDFLRKRAFADGLGYADDGEEHFDGEEEYDDGDSGADDDLGAEPLDGIEQAGDFRSPDDAPRKGDSRAKISASTVSGGQKTLLSYHNDAAVDIGKGGAAKPKSA